MGFWSSNNEEGSDCNNDKSAIDKPETALSPEKKRSNFSHRAEKSLEKYGKVHSALSEGTVVQGKLSFDTPVRIDGKLSGEVYSTSVLVVGEKGEIDAVVKAESLIIQGQVRGDIKVSQKIELQSGGLLEGDISTGALVIQEESIFRGNCTMGQAPKTLDISSEDLKKAEQSAESSEAAPDQAAAEEKPAQEKSDESAQHEVRVH